MINVITLRNVFGKVPPSYWVNPCKDKNGRYPDCVKPVNSLGDMILSDKELASGKIYIKETEEFEIFDGKTFNLNDDYQKAVWEAIKNCPFIAEEVNSKDDRGNSLINGSALRYGIADFYIERVGEQEKVKNKKKELLIEASQHVYNDSQNGRLTKCKLLNKNMDNAHPEEVTAFLYDQAERFPEKIINLYTGSDSAIRLLFIDALGRNVIVKRNGVFMYGDLITLGMTDDAVINYLRSANNDKIVASIKKETYPELEITNPKAAEMKAKKEAAAKAKPEAEGE